MVAGGSRQGCRVVLWDSGDAQDARTRLHYSDPTCLVPQGRIAIELQLTTAGRRPLEMILAAYARKPSIVVVFYLVQDGVIGDVVQAAAVRLGLARAVHVQRVQFDLSAH
jgi:hypothetical protein